MAEQTNIPRATLVHGLRGIGKKKGVLDEIALYVCHHPSPAPCEKCSACLKLIQRTHPDFFILENTGKSIGIEEIRDLQGKLHRAPLEAPFKWVVIDEAEKMTIQAANSLLKTLEEPPPRTFFYLITSNPGKLLLTIRSRCIKRLVKTPTLNEGVNFLMKKRTESREFLEGALKLSSGSLGLAEVILDSQILEKLKTLPLGRERMTFDFISQKASELADGEEDLIFFLEILKARLFNDYKEGKGDDPLGKLESIFRAQKDIEMNVNPVLVLENLLMDLQVNP